MEEKDVLMMALLAGMAYSLVMCAYWLGLYLFTRKG